MQFTVSAAALLALVSSALAQTSGFDPITAPTKDQELPAGSSFDIVWQPSAAYTGTVTLSLLGGKSPETLTTVATIKSGVDNSAGKFTWAIDSTLGKDATYGIQITLDSDKTIFQYSFPFHIKGDSSGSSSSSSSESTSASGTATYTITRLSSSSTESLSSYPTITPSGNLSTTATTGPTQTTITSTAGGGGSGGSRPSGPSAVPTSGASAVRAAAGSLALLGGLAAVAFAL